MFNNLYIHKFVNWVCNFGRIMYARITGKVVVLKHNHAGFCPCVEVQYDGPEYTVSDNLKHLILDKCGNRVLIWFPCEIPNESFPSYDLIEHMAVYLGCSGRNLRMWPNYDMEMIFTRGGLDEFDKVKNLVNTFNPYIGQEPITVEFPEIV